MRVSEKPPLTKDQRNSFIAALLGWTMDAFDYFLVVLVYADIAKTFHHTKAEVAFLTTATLLMRPVGALLFGLWADRVGRRLPLMVDVVFYSVVGFLCAFAPNFTVLVILRLLYGIGMGGEWGLGAALAMEKVPVERRGFFSGLLQEGYPIGYLLASVVFAFLFVHIGWRGMFIASSASALLVLYIRFGVEESPAWVAGVAARRASAATAWKAIRTQFPKLLYLVLLMACFNAFSHGSQDLYPTFLQAQHGYSAKLTGEIAIAMNLGALAGGVCFGAWSESLGRRRAIIIASVLALPMIPLWAFSHSAVLFACGGFLAWRRSLLRN